jgi:hypothetical protein
MRRIRGVDDEGHHAVEKPATVGPLLICIFPDRLDILPLIADRAQAASCDARLQGLITAWAEQPELLAELCELGPQTAPAVSPN